MNSAVKFYYISVQCAHNSRTFYYLWTLQSLGFDACFNINLSSLVFIIQFFFLSNLISTFTIFIIQSAIISFHYSIRYSLLSLFNPLLSPFIIQSAIFSFYYTIRYFLLLLYNPLFSPFIIQSAILSFHYSIRAFISFYYTIRYSLLLLYNPRFYLLSWCNSLFFPFII